ncbi:unnamed protein product [Clonostachys rhizophaga]|uniref:Rhodopsin domain-containing protein n=1 Tax=Clonostachys rhizophaga TaxID=160324 RepID=A0A9N9W3E5_9HYPO|nr:unnamed protein product [Clonostachys rhizophaga]
MDDLQHFIAEVWSLFALATTFTGIRMFARFRSVGWKQFTSDDYLACSAILFYSFQVMIAYKGGTLYRSRSTTGALAEQQEWLEPNSPPLLIRAQGSKYHLASWPLYATTLWLLKASVLVLYMRLTTGLAGAYRIRIIVGFTILATSWAAVILTTLLACQPFQGYFNTTDMKASNACSPAVSKPIVWTCYSMNVSTDIFLIALPIPMLWKTSIKLWKKIGLCVLFSGGAIVVVFATVRCVLLTTNPTYGAPLSGTWGVREGFVAIITSNFPMAFTLVRGMLGPAFNSLQTTTPSAQTPSTQLDTLKASGRNGRSARSAVMSDRIFTESEEKIVNGRDTPPNEEVNSPA